MTTTIIMITYPMQCITHMMTSISICIIILFILTSCNFALWSDIFAWNIFSNGCAAYSYIRSQSTNYFVSSGLLLPLPYDFDMAFDRGWHFIQGWLFMKLMHHDGTLIWELFQWFDVLHSIQKKTFHTMDCLLNVLHFDQPLFIHCLLNMIDISSIKNLMLYE